MICCTADGTTVRALLLRGAATAGRQKTALRKRPVRNCFMLIILLDNLRRDAGLLAPVAYGAVPHHLDWTRESAKDHCHNAATLCRTSATKASSLISPRLISTFASAPSTAARAKLIPTARSDAILGLVIGRSDSSICRTSLARSATSSGTSVAFLVATSTSAFAS